jgi:hypothetical protein
MTIDDNKMTKGEKWVAAAIVTFLVGGGALMLTKAHNAPPPSEAPQGRLHDGVISEQTFPAGFDVTGEPDTGHLCHGLEHMLPGGKTETFKFHRIMDRDFRDGTVADKERWITADVSDDASEVGIACGGGGGEESPFFSPAYADTRRCDDCGGDGCIAWTCPATFHENTTPPCSLNGSTCAITYLCCPGPGLTCVPSC